MRWSSALTIEELERRGVVVAPFQGATFRLSPKAALVVAIPAVGAAGLWVRADRLGRDVAWNALALVAAVMVLAFAWMHVRAVRRLVRFRVEGLEPVGWGFDMFGTPPLPSIRVSGVTRRVGTAIVGVFLGDQGLSLHVDHSDVGVVGSDQGYDLSIGLRGSRAWVIVRRDGLELALRIHQGPAHRTR